MGSRRSVGQPRLLSLRKPAPLLFRDDGLLENSVEQVLALVAPMGVGDPRGQAASDHEVVLVALVRALEPRLSEVANEVPPAYRAEGGHRSVRPRTEPKA